MDNENRGRRVTDKILEAAQHALKIERLEGRQELLAQRVTAAMENVTNTLAAVQVEMKGFSVRLSELAGLQQAHDTNKGSIEKMERSVQDLRETLDNWLEDFGDRQDQRWLRHEAENENTKRDFEKEIRGVRETVIRFAAFGAAMTILGGTVVGGFIWNINYRFNEGKEDVREAKETASMTRELVDGTLREVTDIKLYLAGGGRIPEEPYIPKSQRKQNDQSK